MDSWQPCFQSGEKGEGGGGGGGGRWVWIAFETLIRVSSQ